MVGRKIPLVTVCHLRPHKGRLGRMAARAQYLKHLKEGHQWVNQQLNARKEQK